MYFQSCLHMGHWCEVCCVDSHFSMQWMWKQWLHSPHTRGQSSPANLQSGQHPSNATRQIPHVSSLANHFHTAHPDQDLIVTFSRELDGLVWTGMFSSPVIVDTVSDDTTWTVSQAPVVCEPGTWFSMFSLSITILLFQYSSMLYFICN